MSVMQSRLLIFIENLVVCCYRIHIFQKFQFCPPDRLDLFCMALSLLSCVYTLRISRLLEND